MAKARRGRGEGSVFFDERRNEWVGSLSLGIDADGKRIRRTIYAPSKKEAQQRLADLRNRTGAELANRRAPTVREFIEGWLEREVKPNRRATTYRSYEGIARRHVLPYVGAKRVNLATPADIERCVAIVREKAGASMAGKVRTLLHRVFRRAVALEIAARNPVTSVEAPRHEKKAMQFLDAGQVRTLLDAAAGDRLEALAVVLVTAGLRIGEALALRWCDLDVQKRTLRIERSAQEAAGAIAFVAPKTKAGRRMIALGALAIDALKRRYADARREGYDAPGDLIFGTGIGTPYRQTNLHRRWWHPLLQKAGLPKIRLHDLRHTAASLSLAAGTDARTVSDRLGHADASLTQRVYQHAVESLHRADAKAVDELLKAPLTGKP
ncbi:MAG: tyrosine-type recombinase/integrase [Vulcanimicrobiaceae bacterium]